MKGGAARTHDAYLAALADPEQRAALADLRQRLVVLLPDADQVISYSMPAFRLRDSGRVVAGYAAARHFCSYYPFSGTTLGTLAAQITGHGHTRSALHFSPAQPISDALLALLIDTRRREIAAPTPIRYRPHHFLCSLGFEGKGYSDAFTANMTAIVIGRLRAESGDATLIEVVPATDDICAPCPKRRGTACATQDEIETLDRAHAAALGLCPGDRITWSEAKSRIRANLPQGSLKTLCRGCDWEPYGMCEAALARLHADPA